MRADKHGFSRWYKTEEIEEKLRRVKQEIELGGKKNEGKRKG